ncbi:hypothetical protein HAX54_045569, partial [Datura stramonium]|nr:hypothetical protein [Datura stramonium]
MALLISPALPNGSSSPAPAPAPATELDEESLTHPLLNSLRRSASNNTSQVAIVGSSVFPIESLDY